MENSTMTTSQLIADSYVSYHNQVYLYILHKVNCREEAEDLSQDVFLRLMEYKQMLRPDTVKFFIYTISRNLVNDYWRRFYKKQEISSFLRSTGIRSICPAASCCMACWVLPSRQEYAKVTFSCWAMSCSSS